MLSSLRWSRSTRRRLTAISGKSCGGWSSAWAAPGPWPIWKRPADCFGFPGIPTDREEFVSSFDDGA